MFCFYMRHDRTGFRDQIRRVVTHQMKVIKQIFLRDAVIDIPWGLNV